MKFAICGDSWWTSDLKFPECSFGEILAKQNNWDLVSLARGGCSNFAIALQVDTAIKLNVDFIIVGATGADRIELPIKHQTNLSFWDRVKNNFNWRGWMENGSISVYDKLRGLSNIEYQGHGDLSSQQFEASEHTIISDSLNNLAFIDPLLPNIDGNFNDNRCHITTQQQEALKTYMLELYDYGIKFQYDRWIMSDACRRIVDSKIPFLFCPNVPVDCPEFQDYDWITKQNMLLYKDFNFEMFKFCENHNNEPRFHYHPKDSGKPIADYFDKRIKETI